MIFRAMDSDPCEPHQIRGNHSSICRSFTPGRTNSVNKVSSWSPWKGNAGKERAMISVGLSRCQCRGSGIKNAQLATGHQCQQDDWILAIAGPNILSCLTQARRRTERIRRPQDVDQPAINYMLPVVEKQVAGSGTAFMRVRS